MLLVNVPGFDPEMIQQHNQLLYPCITGSVVTGNLDETYSKSSQPWGGFVQAMDTNEAPYTDIDHFVFRPGEMVVRGPSMEKICDRFAFPTLENYVDQLPVVFGVSECDFGVRFRWIEVTKAGFQAEEEKVLPFLKMFAVLVYCRAPFIRILCQTRGSGFQLYQVV